MAGEVRKRRLPPLGLLITAETVARSASFTAASDELHVTPSAVSHQIRALEQWLGFPLFRRNTRSVSPTAQGRQYLASVSDVLNQLEMTTSEAMEQAGKLIVLRLQTTDSFAARWLVDRLPSFMARHPEMAVRVVTWEYTEGFRSAEADLAVLYGHGELAGAQVMPILPESILPVCAPEVAERARQSEGSRFTYTLLHDDNLGTSWEQWWHSARGELDQYPIIDLQAGLHFNHSHLALRAAEQGSGLVLASWPLVIDALRRRELVAPFQHQFSTGFAYHLVQSPDSRVRDRCRLLSEWLLEEAVATPVSLPPCQLPC